MTALSSRNRSELVCAFVGLGVDSSGSLHAAIRPLTGNPTGLELVDVRRLLTDALAVIRSDERNPLPRENSSHFSTWTPTTPLGCRPNDYSVASSRRRTSAISRKITLACSTLSALASAVKPALSFAFTSAPLARRYLSRSAPPTFI